VLVDFRSDGTASFAGDTANNIDWIVSENELAIFQTKTRRSTRWVFHRYITGIPTSRYKLLDSSEDQFELLDLQTSKKFRFRRTTNETLKMAP
jgi:hypothetical protein